MQNNFLLKQYLTAKRCLLHTCDYMQIKQCNVCKLNKLFPGANIASFRVALTTVILRYTMHMGDKAKLMNIHLQAVTACASEITC